VVSISKDSYASNALTTVKKVGESHHIFQEVQLKEFLDKSGTKRTSNQGKNNEDNGKDLHHVDTKKY